MTAIRKTAKIKLKRTLKHYNKYGWLKQVVYRLRHDKAVRKYIRTFGEVWEIREGMFMQDMFYSSRVKRSRVKNVPDGSMYVPNYKPKKGLTCLY